jgi:hypothetical protein
MSKVSATPKIIKQLAKPKDKPLLDPKIHYFKTYNNRINFVNNPNLDPKIRFFNVTKDNPDFPIGFGAWNRNRGVTNQDRARAKLERLAWEKSFKNPETSSASFEAEGRASSQDQTLTSTFLPFEPDVTSSYPEKKSAIKALAETFEARKKTEQAARNDSSITTANMSSELTKVLAKDACPRKSSDPYRAIYLHCLVLYLRRPSSFSTPSPPPLITSPLHPFFSHFLSQTTH